LKATLSAPALETTIRCSVAAAAMLRAAPEAIAQWRRQPIVVGDDKMPVSFLKHSEDQTVVAIRTILAALEQQGWQSRSFTDWGVIAAPSFFGRVCSARSFQRFLVDGAWGASPHLIPHQSLHGLAGTLSQALKIHGPNFGVSGAPNAGPDAFLIAAAMLADGALPGLWVVLTGHESEAIPERDGDSQPASICHAVALALTPASNSCSGGQLSIGPVTPQAAAPLALWPEFHLNLLADEFLAHPHMPCGKWRLGSTHWLELETPLPDSEASA
jgi:hypothetical protein